MVTRLMGWVGQSYMAAQADAQIYLTNNNIPSGLRLEAVYSRQKYYENDKLFFQDNSPAFISHYDAFGRIGYEWAVGRRGKAMIGVGGAAAMTDSIPTTGWISRSQALSRRRWI